MKRKNLMFLAAAVIVAVGVIGIYMNYPPVRSEDARGAIGAVEKYRSDQITSAGVVLADEKTRKEESAAYGGYLEQASQLQNLSMELQNFALTFAAQESLAGRQRVEAQTRLQSISESIGSQSEALSQKMAELTSYLAGQEQLASFEADLAGLAQSLQSRQLEMRQLENMQLTLAQMAEAIGVDALWAISPDALSLEAKSLESAKRLEASYLAEAQAKLEAATELLGPQTFGLDARQVLQIQEHLQFANRALASRQMENLSVELALQQLASHALEARVLRNAELTLASLDLAAEMAGNRSALQNLSLTFASHAESLEARAFRAMDQRLSSRQLEAKALESMDLTLASLTAEMANRSKDNRSAYESMNLEFANLDKALSSRMQELGRQVVLSSYSEISALDSYFANRAALEGRLRLRSSEAEAANLASVAGRSLDNRGQSLDLASRNSALFNRHLENITAALQNRAIAASERQALEAKAGELGRVFRY
jgi:hypothetical protein